MTPEEQRSAIAEVCGWKHLHIVRGLGVHPKSKHQILEPLPDFLTDLNSIREAEKTLGEDDCQRYHVELAEWWNRNATEKYTGFAGDYPWHASAKQRAEAFLRTLNIWKETPPV